MRVSQRSIEQVRQAANIVEVASEFTALRRAGARFSGLCPYPDHQEKTPSFSVAPDKNVYYCFGCQRGGDSIKLVVELKSLPFVEAVSHLAERFGIELEMEGRSPEQERAARERASRRRSAHKALAAATVYYQKYLSKSPAAEAARRYLERRGIVSSTIEEFRLGYAPPRGTGGFAGAARKIGLGRDALETAGLLSPRGGERFLDRITFPISDPRGRMVGFGARALRDEVKPKYLNSPETELFNKRSLLYGFPQVAEAVRREQSALVVEGYTDVLMLYQSGIKNAVATLGTAMTEQHLKMLSGYAGIIHLLFDPDAAGEKAVERAAATAAELKLDLRVLRLPEDPADWLLEHSSEEFRALLSDAVPVFEYVFRRKAGNARGASAAERSRILSEVEGLVREIEDPVFQRDAVRLAAESLGVDPSALYTAKSTISVPRESHREESQSARRDPLVEAGRELLALALAHPQLTEQLLKEGVQTSALPQPVKLGAEDFDDEAQARVFQLLQRHAGKGLDAVVSDEDARPHLDLISLLSAKGSRDVYSVGKGRKAFKMMPSKAEAVDLWFRLLILSRQRSKALTTDYDVKERLYAEITLLKNAQEQARNQHAT
ncbi:MAG: DNA primase [Actinomycetota bacterium]|nr:DNA primase [Actinomycetota bacterium]